MSYIKKKVKRLTLKGKTKHEEVKSVVERRQDGKELKTRIKRNVRRKVNFDTGMLIKFV